MGWTSLRHFEPLEHLHFLHFFPQKYVPGAGVLNTPMADYDKVAFRGSWWRLILRGQQIRLVTVLAIPTLPLSLSISPLETRYLCRYFELIDDCFVDHDGCVVAAFCLVAFSMDHCIMNTCACV